MVLQGLALRSHQPLHSDIAYLAHSLRSGRGVRDFRRDLIHKAPDKWKQMVDGGTAIGAVGREGIGYMEYIYLSHLGSAGNAV